MNRTITVVWKEAHPEVSPRGSARGARVEVLHGKLQGVEGPKGRDRLTISLSGVRCAPGPEATLVTVVGHPDASGLSDAIDENAFSFFLRDVSAAHPIFLPACGVVVTDARDRRGYAAIARAIRARGGMTELGRIESEREESFAAAAEATREMRCPTWLGLSRDIRVFELGFREWTQAWHWIQPRFHGYPVTLDDEKKTPLRYHWLVGRGIGCAEHLARRLDEGVLPILHATQVEGGMEYRVTAFVAPGLKRFSAGTLRGTDYRVADRFSHGIMMGDEERARIDARLSREMPADDQSALFLRAEAANTARVPRYAWFRSPFPANDGSTVNRSAATDYDARTGFASLKAGGVFCVSRLDGAPLPQEETAVLVPPGKCVTFEFVVPHRPVSPARARRLARQDFDRRLRECRAFWKRKLAAAATVRVPQKRIDEMIRAGLLHLDMITYGREPKGPLAATVGAYSPIGSESSPIIQFMDSMGRHDVARRALDYFLDKQRPDGLMMNFGGYQLETGGVLWSLGEHYRYTRDDAWVRRIAPKVLRSCDYILAWRRRNMREDLRGRGYGLVDGKVADPEDPFHSFMLNGIMCIGLSRAAQMLASVRPVDSKRLALEAEAFRRDVRQAFAETMARSPVVPLGDGSWVPTAAPWTESRGPVCLFAEKGAWFTHGAFPVRDSLIGPMYLILHEVLDPRESAAGFLLNYHAELFHERNVALSQPYYSPHPFAHLARGEVKAFLKEYYNGVASLADRETCTFWEHYHHASPHKTHEEGWFLMRTRRMLWTEEGDTLRLLAGVPRAWLEDGKRIDIEGAASYFGPLAIHVKSRVARGRIEAAVATEPRRRPGVVEIRLPHPQGAKARRCSGGVYDPETETARVAPFTGRARVTLRF